jgi:hypothetical protein
MTLFCHSTIPTEEGLWILLARGLLIAKPQWHGNGMQVQTVTLFRLYHSKVQTKNCNSPGCMALEVHWEKSTHKKSHKSSHSAGKEKSKYLTLMQIETIHIDVCMHCPLLLCTVLSISVARSASTLSSSASLDIRIQFTADLTCL